MKKLLLIAIMMLNYQVTMTYNHHVYHTADRSRVWGIHTMIDLHRCSHHLIRSTWDMSLFIQRVCAFIGVTALGTANIMYHQSGYGYSSGYTIMQHGNGHTDIVLRVNEFNDSIFVDIFSCRSYDPHQLVNLTQDFFGAYEATVDILYRK